MRHEAPPQPSGLTVSATDFVRGFAQYKRAADSTPVYIEAHGKPGWALVSTALLDAMTRGGMADPGLYDIAAKLDVILDTISTRTILLDDGLIIRRINAAFRSHARVSDAGAIGRPLSAVLLGPPLDTLRDAAQRVIESATTEVLEIESVLNPGRLLAVTVARTPDGVALLADDITTPAELGAIRADVNALRVAAGAIPGVCLGRINPRGAIDSADANLSALSGIANDALLGARLGSLFEMASRVRVNDLVEQVLDGGPPGWTRGRLLARGAEPVAAAIGLAAIRGRQGATGAAFIIQDRSPLASDPDARA